MLTIGQGSLHFGNVLDSQGTFTFDRPKMKPGGFTEGEQNNEGCSTDLQKLLCSH